MSCGVGCRYSLDLALLWLWHRPLATALIKPLAWEPPYAAGVALKKTKRQQQQKKPSFFWSFSRAAPAAHGDSQARGRIGTVAVGLCHSHSNLGSEPYLQPTLQLTAMLDSSPTEQGQGLNPQPHGS